MKIFEEIDDKSGISSIYNEFGAIYLTEKNYATSLEYFGNSIAICDELEDEYGKAAPYTNSGQLHLEQGILLIYLLKL